MIENVIKITAATENLQPTPEYWQSSTFADMEARVKAAYAHHDFVFRLGTKCIREMTFKIKADTTLLALQKLCDVIHERYGISCFQIAIYRAINEARLLFLWVNLEDCKMRYLNDSDQKKLSVTILRHLNLPRPKVTDEWLRIFLQETWEESPEDFTVALDWLDHAGATAPIYTVLRDSLVYASRVCQKLSK